MRGRNPLTKESVFSLILIALLLAAGSARPQQKEQTAATGSAESARMREQVSEGLAATRAELETIAAGAPADSPAGRRRLALQQRAKLFEQYAGVLTTLEKHAAEKRGSVDRADRVAKQLESLAAEPEPTPPASVSKDGFEDLQASVAKQRDRVASIEAMIGERGQRLENIPRLIPEARSRADEAERQATRLAEEVETAADETMKGLLSLKLENARLDEQVALRSVEALRLEAELERALEPVRSAELELAQKRLERLETQLSLYSQAREKQVGREQRDMEQELARKQREATEAASPDERFTARWEAAILLSGKHKSDVEAFLVGLTKETTEQEARQDSDKEELANLESLLRRSGTYGKVGERVQLALRQLKLRRQVLTRAMRSPFLQTLNTYRGRRFEIVDMLFLLNETWKNEREAVAAELPEEERPRFKARTAGLLDRYRGALRDEKGLLTQAIAQGQHLEALYLERLENQDALERFIRSKAFFLRDSKPLGGEVLRPLGTEIRSLIEWVRQVSSEGTASRLADTARSPLGIFLGVLAFPVLPGLIYYVRRSLRRFTRNRNERALDQGSTLRGRAVTIFVSTLSAILLPVYFLAAAKLARAAGLPVTLGPVLTVVLEHVAYFLLFWFLARAYFRERGIAPAHFGMHSDAAHALHGSLRLFLLGYVAWFTLWRVLGQPPFEFTALPRLSYTLFLLTTGAAIVWLLRPGSPMVWEGFAAGRDNIVTRHWTFFFGLAALLSATVVALDVAGYRYGASAIARSSALSLGTLLVLIPLYRGVVTAIVSIPKVRTGAAGTPPADDEAEPSEKTPDRLLRFVRALFIVVAVLLFAGYWGLDRQALRTLEEIHLYAIRGAGEVDEFLTAANLFLSVLFFGGTFWILRALPGIYEFAVWPRLNFDEGLKYAVLTISRYSLFVTGMLLGFSELHLDLGRLGWLMAAVGVGLGFGLQEIVSNFVSGIILLVERPVQVGDIVTVGTMSGTIKRINIRATSILNFDRREVLVPNRSLITREVTNWTRGDTINRLVIRIGVAYGSDVEEVSELLLKIAQDQPEVLQDPAPSVIFMDHGESSLDFDLRVFIPSPGVMMTLRDQINKDINRELARRGIQIPFPQRDLHLRSSEVSLDEFLREREKRKADEGAPPLLSD